MHEGERVLAYVPTPVKVGDLMTLLSGAKDLTLVVNDDGVLEVRA